MDPTRGRSVDPRPAPRRRLPLGGFHDGAFDLCRPEVGRVDRTARIRGQAAPASGKLRQLPPWIGPKGPSVQLGRDWRTRPRVRWDQGRSSEGVAHEPQSGRESATCATAGPKVPLIGCGHAAAVTAREEAVSTRLRGPRGHAAHLRTPRRLAACRRATENSPLDSYPRRGGASSISSSTTLNVLNVNDTECDLAYATWRVRVVLVHTARR